ncbi:MAG: cation-translocating P-type ATPase [Actinomycetes bacterium]
MASPGLTVAEAARRLSVGGPNSVPGRTRVSVWSRIGAQLRDPLIVVLLAASALTVLTGDLADTVVIALVVVVNTTVGVSQEMRADRAITALAELTAPSVRVVRGGTEQMVPSADLVPDDLVVLAEGDIVPADGSVLEASALLVDESALTGESVAVGHGVPQDGADADVLSAGTVVVKGRAVLRVTATGRSSALGRIAALVDTRPQPTPLQLRLVALGRVLALVAVSLCAVVLATGLVRGEPLEVMLVTAVSLAVAAVPESLPAVVTVSLTLGARRMAQRNAIIRRLAAVETLGSVSVLATDKTGTLTQGRMAVREIWTPRKRVTVTDETTGPVDEEHDPDVVAVLRAAVLCNDAQLVSPTSAPSGRPGLGDPTEVALLAAANRVGLTRAGLDREYPRVDEVPFDSRTRRMTTVHAMQGAGSPRVLVVTKGSPESLANRDGRQAGEWRTALRRATELADTGHRVLAFTAGTAPAGGDWSATEHELLGLVAMDDPAKPAARTTIDACVRAGITPVLITGDHPATALAMAERVGVLTAADGTRHDSVATGDQVAAGAIPDLTVPRVFARANPEQKLAIVQAWKDRGAVVAMTGDGVNDGPALRRADIGVAMGHRGTEVARQAADLVLADDDLGTVVAAVEEGRRVYANIRRFLVFGLAGGSAEILVMLLGPFAGLTLPLLAAQILWINLLTHGLTGVALGAEPVEARVMERAPRPPEESVLGDGLWQRVLVIGTLLAATSITLGVWGDATGRAWQTMVFLALTSLQLGVAYALRPRLFTRQNLLLPAAIAGSLVLALAGVYLPALQDLLGTTSLPAADTALALSTACVGFVVTRLPLRWTQRWSDSARRA